ncbi:MAG: TetR-like C-terminal domain-containing protein [Chloroflexota bacterium]
MYRINDDQRAIRSGEMLYDGLAKLIREKPLDEITVTDLVQAAQVGRATFYRNFDYIEDVLRLRCDQVCEGLVAYYINYVMEYGTEARPPLLQPMLRYFDTHSDMIELLMLADRLDIFSTSFRRVFDPFRARFAERFGVEEEYADYAMAIRIGFITSVLVHWIETGKQQEPDELAEKLSGMITNMVLREQLL